MYAAFGVLWLWRSLVKVLCLRSYVEGWFATTRAPSPPQLLPPGGGSVVMGGRNVTMRFKNQSVITRGCRANRDSACDEILSRITLACYKEMPNKNTKNHRLTPPTAFFGQCYAQVQRRPRICTKQICKSRGLGRRSLGDRGHS